MCKILKTFATWKFKFCVNIDAHMNLLDISQYSQVTVWFVLQYIAPDTLPEIEKKNKLILLIQFIFIIIKTNRNALRKTIKKHL